MSKGKHFFFEKKKQKTFYSSTSPTLTAPLGAFKRTTAQQAPQ
jgi:hypothetical protein